MSEQNTIITVTEAAALRDTNPDKIRHWLRQGWIKSARKAGRVWLMERDEVLNFEPPNVGWQPGVNRCPRCSGALTDDHQCEPEQGESDNEEKNEKRAE